MLNERKIFSVHSLTRQIIHVYYLLPFSLLLFGFQFELQCSNLIASNEIPDLSHIPSIVRADDGARGCGDNCHGSCAKHIYLKVS